MTTPPLSDEQEIVELIMNNWTEELERVGATTFSGHSLRFLKDQILKSIQSEKAAHQKRVEGLLEALEKHAEKTDHITAPHGYRLMPIIKTYERGRE